ncbi:flagellar assembly factor FliW [Metabacillus crassostreae]|uniref:flagellar assembly protein FliW n=1 Tax=Metabacillus crassostreae TaxID=929098 RepID=UPI001958B798|nr:flagellar assembly protein FliW [Metabacillus crassostreae]MBM7606242.1 flagellar assembly factor FliW [Metabacillus crassostreae]
MNVETKYHGVIEVLEKEIIHFQSGIPGFQGEKSFVLLQLEEDSPFWILQSMTTSQLGFVTVEPFQYFTTYEFEISENDRSNLSLKSEKDVAIWVFLTIKEPFIESTANLQAPIIINSNNRQAKQIILNDSNYKTRERLFPEEIEK